MTDRQLTTSKTISIIIIVLAFCVFVGAMLVLNVEPISKIDLTNSKIDSSKSGLELVTVILGILAAGCTAIFFSFTYEDAGEKEHISVKIMCWSLIGAFSLLVFLCMYCLQKIGAFGHMDVWARYIVFLATFLMLCGLVLIERWDATMLTRKICPFCKSRISWAATKCPKCTSDLSKK